MAETLSIRQQIADAILAGLTTITLESGAQFTPSQITEASSLGVEPSDQALVLVEVESNASIENAASNGSVFWLTTWAVQAYIFEPESSLYSPRKRARIVLAEVQKLLMTNYQWGGIVQDTLPQRVDWFDLAADKGAAEGFTFYFTTQHGEELTDPYQLRV